MTITPNNKNTIKAGGSTAHAQNVDWVSGVEWSGYPLDCYEYWSTYGAKKGFIWRLPSHGWQGLLI